MLERTQHTLTYRTVKNFGGKIVWRIRTVGSLVEKLWRIEVHYIGNVMEIVTPPMFFTVKYIHAHYANYT